MDEKIIKLLGAASVDRAYDTCWDMARAQLSALRAAGYDVVPVEPTDKMLYAGRAEPLTARRV